MAYKYRAYTPDKKIVQGTLDTASESTAEAALYRAGYQRVLSLREVPPGPSLETLIPSFFAIKPRDVIDFSQQLATLLESGLPILTALKLLERQAHRDAFRNLLGGLSEKIQGGDSLPQAISKYPEVFSSTYYQVIKASEQTGNLEVGLRQMAAYLEKQAATRQKIRRAMTYPVGMLLLAIGVVILLVTVALPPLVTLFTTLGSELPPATRLLIATADFMLSYKLHWLGGLLALSLAAFYYSRLPSGRLNLDKLLLRLPVIGTISLEREVQRFCQTSSMLLRAGLGLPRIMESATRIIGNKVIQQALMNVTGKLIQGQGLSQPMAEESLFPPLLVEMIIVGEKTGTLDTNLASLADYYERRVDQRISGLTAMIEPLMTLIIGLVVIALALAVIMPLYTLLRSI